MGVRVFILLFLSSFLIQDAWAGQTYYLNDLKQSVIGKTKEEIHSLFESPNKVNPTQSDETGSWEYGYGDRFTWGKHWTVINDENSLPCWTVDIDFQNGKADTVSVSNCKE